MDGMNFSRKNTQIPRKRKRRIYVKRIFKTSSSGTYKYSYPMKNRTALRPSAEQIPGSGQNRSSFRRGSVVFTVINSEDIAKRHGKGEFLFSHEKRDYGSTSGRRGRVGWKRKNFNVFSWLALWVHPENSFLNERLH